MHSDLSTRLLNSKFTCVLYPYLECLMLILQEGLQASILCLHPVSVFLSQKFIHFRQWQFDAWIPISANHRYKSKFL